MLILAEGTVHRPIANDEHTAVWGWLGPMVDAGFMQSGFINKGGDRLWLVLSSTDVETAAQRLADLPVVQDGSVSFSTTEITAARFR
jgi:hypothetical protein